MCRQDRVSSGSTGLGLFLLIRMVFRIRSDAVTWPLGERIEWTSWAI